MTEIVFRATGDLWRTIRQDLHRPHAYAAERVGFILCRMGSTQQGVVILAERYEPVDDSDYIPARNVGALLGPAAFRKALQSAYAKGAQDYGLFHIHAHLGKGQPRFSGIDLKEYRRFVPDFFNAAPKMAHGALVINDDSAIGLCWLNKSGPPVVIAKIVSVAAPLQIWRGA